MESATCCGMELRRSRVCNHHEVMYGINPKVEKRGYALKRDAMPSQATDSIQRASALITYQSFGLDRKKHACACFFLAG